MVHKTDKHNILLSFHFPLKKTKDLTLALKKKSNKWKFDAPWLACLPHISSGPQTGWNVVWQGQLEFFRKGWLWVGEWKPDLGGHCWRHWRNHLTSSANCDPISPLDDGVSQRKWSHWANKRKDSCWVCHSGALHAADRNHTASWNILFSLMSFLLLMSDECSVILHSPRYLSISLKCDPN